MSLPTVGLAVTFESSVLLAPLCDTWHLDIQGSAYGVTSVLDACLVTSSGEKPHRSASPRMRIREEIERQMRKIRQKKKAENEYIIVSSARSFEPLVLGQLAHL